MYIPSTRVYEEMQVEHASAWFVPTGKLQLPYLLVKLPTVSLKRLIATSELRFTFALYQHADRQILTQGFLVQDSDEHPMVVVGRIRHPEELRALHGVMNSLSVPIVLFDELARPVAAGTVGLDSDAATAIARRLPESVYSGPYDEGVDYVLDDFQYQLDSSLAHQQGRAPIWLEPIEMTCNGFRVSEIFGIGAYGAHRFSLLDPDEGSGLEQSAWQLLESLYGVNLHRSPMLERGASCRELTDVLAEHELGACLIETKALAAVGVDRSMRRRTRNIEKDIAKGLRQLSGAIRGVREGGVVRGSKGQKIACTVAPHLLPQAIVLISDMDQGLNWVDIGQQLIERSVETRVFFHVFDLHELRVLMGGSHSPKHLLANLCRRYQALLDEGHGNIRSRMPPSE